MTYRTIAPAITLGKPLSQRHRRPLASIKNTCTVRGVKVTIHLFLNVFTTLATLVNVVRLSDSLPVWARMQLAVLRLITSLAFGALVIFYRPSGTLLNAYWAIAILFAIPTLFYVASHSLLSAYELNDISAAVASGYAFLPFLLMTGLSIQSEQQLVTAADRRMYAAKHAGRNQICTNN